MTSRRASDDTLDSTVSHVSCADGEPVSPYLESALNRLAAPDGPAATFTVEPDPESVTAARHFATATLKAWGMAALCDDVGLVVSELVTNALRHSLPPCPGETATATIRLRLLRAEPYLLCGVIDAGAAVPRRREPDYIAETGRGLHVVESFSARWGWTRLAPSRKIVWAVFQVPH
jgi:anti-sigma regulatory factor (Ser/Thr protein kinase)